MLFTYEFYTYIQQINETECNSVQPLHLADLLDKKNHIPGVSNCVFKATNHHFMSVTYLCMIDI